MKYIQMLPFLDKEDLDELVEKIISGEVTTIKTVMLYPFLDKESIDKLVDHDIKDNNASDLASALPFISKEKINEIYEKINDGTITGVKEEILMPFLGKNKIKEMFYKYMNESKDLDEE